MNMLFIGGIGTTELVLIVIVLLLCFGSTKLPDLMRGAGKGIREFKDAMNNPDSDKSEDKADDKKESKKDTK